MKEKTSTYGLVGYPIKKSLSPVMHNTAFQALGVEAEYTLFEMTEDQLETFFKNLKKEDSPIFGLNVTVPYKEKVIPLLDSLSPFAQKVGAVNTVMITPHRQLAGQNTDGPGFLTHLSDLEVDVEGKRVAILGAGGAARAVISVLCLIPERPHSIKIYDIDTEKARQLVDDLGVRIDVSMVSCVNSIDDLNIELADLLVNTTPIGMKDQDPCLVDEELLHKDMFVYDLIYNPARTKLLQLAESKGARVSNGLGMLFYQGVLAFQHWADIELNTEIKELMWASLQQGKVL